MYGTKKPMTFGSPLREKYKYVQNIKFKEGWKMQP